MASRILGSASEADDAVQESWLRLQRSDAADVHNLGGWLTTVVGRVCLDILRSRTARREEPLDAWTADPTGSVVESSEHDAVLTDSISVALLLVLDTLTPDERLAFVLHDIFAVSFRDIGRILDRTPAASKTLASRARRRIHTAERIPDNDPVRQRAIVAAFLAASRAGDLAALIFVLHPDVVLRADEAAVQLGASAQLRGAEAVAARLMGRAQAARLALIDGAVGAAWAPGGRTRAAFEFTITEGRIAAINIIAEDEHLTRLGVRLIPS